MAANRKTKKHKSKMDKNKMTKKNNKSKTDKKEKKEETEQIGDNNLKTIHFWRPYYLKHGPIKSNEIVFPLLSKTRCIRDRMLPIAGRFRFIKLQQIGPHGLLDAPPVLSLKQRSDAVAKINGKSDTKKNKKNSKKKGAKGKGKKEKRKKSNKIKEKKEK